MDENNGKNLSLTSVRNLAKRTAGALSDGEFRGGVLRQVKKLTLVPEHSPYGVGAIPPEEDLARMSWSDLLALRRKLRTTADQNAVAPFEHRAYARENSDTPAAALQNIVATPMYSAAKVANRAADGVGLKLPIGGSRSDPSLREIGQGIVGAWEGLTK